MKRIIAATLIAANLYGCAHSNGGGDLSDGQKVGLAALLGAAVIYGARKGAFNSSGALTDSEWDWDQFYTQNGPMWACRGVQTGQYADRWHCNGKPMTDWRWPAK